MDAPAGTLALLGLAGLGFTLGALQRRTRQRVLAQVAVHQLLDELDALELLKLGVFGLIGNLVLTRWIDRLGAARCVNIALVSMSLALRAVLNTTSPTVWPVAPIARPVKTVPSAKARIAGIVDTGCS